ncbi:MAG TPA: aldose 1-epimerase [Vicinamibacterales bacterium]
MMLMIAGAAIVPPQAPPYAARQRADVVQLEDARTQTIVSITPSVGNIAFEMTVKGQNALHWPYTSTAEFRAKPAMAGIPFVGPWANRLDETAFYANGTRHAFDMALGNVRGPIPIHGFLTTTDRWQAVEMKADERSAWVTSRLDFSRQADWMKQWPFAHTIDLTYRLQDGVLEVQTKISNTGTEPMPVAIGFHPYFRLTDSPRDQWTLSLGARTRWVLAPNKIPTGETEPADRLFDRPGTRLVEYNLDDVFSDLVRDANGRATMTVAGKSQRLSVQVGPNYRAVVIWAPNAADTGRGSQRLSGPPNPVNRGDFICIEPMAGITDATNLAHKGIYKELQSVPPGGVWQESFWIRVEGF